MKKLNWFNWFRRGGTPEPKPVVEPEPVVAPEPEPEPAAIGPELVLDTEVEYTDYTDYLGEVWASDKKDIIMCHSVLHQLGLVPEHNYQLKVRRTETPGYTLIRLRRGVCYWHWDIAGIEDDTSTHLFGSCSIDNKLDELFGSTCGTKVQLWFSFEKL